MRFSCNSKKNVIRKMSVTILQSKSLSRGVVSDLNALYAEMRVSFYKQPTMWQWRRVLGQKNVRFFVVRESNRVVGMVSFYWRELPAGKVGMVEDMVVSSQHRGKGHGSALTKAVIDFAKKQRLAYIDLTTRPDRVAANKLYQKFGWKRRKTNVYRLLL